MPHPIPDERVVDVAVRYLSHRQLKGQYTTLRDFCHRMGLGKEYLFRKFKEEDIDYALMNHSSFKPNQAGIEILLINLPDTIAKWLDIDNKALYDSYLKMFRQPEQEWIVANDSYKITEDDYKRMQKDLISFSELVRVAKEKGYIYNAIYRATGGPGMIYELPSPVWRPYVLGRKRYFDKQVLNVLHQSDRSYKNPGTAAWKKYQRQISQQQLANPGLFQREED